MFHWLKDPNCCCNDKLQIYFHLYSDTDILRTISNWKCILRHNNANKRRREEDCSWLLRIISMWAQNLRLNTNNIFLFLLLSLKSVIYASLFSSRLNLNKMAAVPFRSVKCLHWLRAHSITFYASIKFRRAVIELFYYFLNRSFGLLAIGKYLLIANSYFRLLIEENKLLGIFNINLFCLLNTSLLSGNSVLKAGWPRIWK